MRVSAQLVLCAVVVIGLSRYSRGQLPPRFGPLGVPPVPGTIPAPAVVPVVTAEPIYVPYVVNPATLPTPINPWWALLGLLALPFLLNRNTGGINLVNGSGSGSSGGGIIINGGGCCGG